MKPLKEQAFKLTRKQSMMKSRITNAKSVSTCVVDQNILRLMLKHIMIIQRRIGNAAFAAMQPLAGTDLGGMFNIVILQRNLNAQYASINHIQKVHSNCILSITIKRQS